jgi:hypothetical protein
MYGSRLNKGDPWKRSLHNRDRSATFASRKNVGAVGIVNDALVGVGESDGRVRRDLQVEDDEEGQREEVDHPDQNDDDIAGELVRCV